MHTMARVYTHTHFGAMEIHTKNMCMYVPFCCVLWEDLLHSVHFCLDDCMKVTCSGTDSLPHVSQFHLVTNGLHA